MEAMPLKFVCKLIQDDVAVCVFVAQLVAWIDRDAVVRTLAQTRARRKGVGVLWVEVVVEDQASCVVAFFEDHARLRTSESDCWENVDAVLGACSGSVVEIVC